MVSNATSKLDYKQSSQHEVVVVEKVEMQGVSTRKSWAELCGANSLSRGNTILSYTPPNIINGHAYITVSPKDVVNNDKMFKNHLVGSFVGRKLSYLFVRETLTKLWKLKGEFEMTTQGFNVYFCKFNCDEDRKKVIEEGLQYISSRLLIIRPCRNIVSLVRVPIKLDRATENRPNNFFGMVLVEVDAEKELPSLLAIIYDNSKVFTVYADYNWLLEWDLGKNVSLVEIPVVKATLATFLKTEAECMYLRLILVLFWGAEAVLVLLRLFPASKECPKQQLIQKLYLASIFSDGEGIWYHFKVIHCNVTVGNDKFMCSFVYASNDPIEGVELWDDLQTFANYFLGVPLVIASDFKSSFSCWDKVGGRTVLNSIVELYTNLLHNTKLTDMKYKRFKTKSALKDWNNSKNAAIPGSAKWSLQRLKSIQNSLQSDPLNLDLIEEERVNLLEYSSISLKEECMYRQLVRITWMKLGDQSTSLFHKSIKARRSRNALMSIRDSLGQIQFDPVFVGRETVIYFTSIIGDG
ncbi:hypothetical protein GIB67_039011 [Kingdonia uniflora]|uniref:DUF4283 domain-containing protein n=1 Tax=Kingdonia uniflora TaxID=39325 RepID=A0A7J7LL14_9MAGN|nr:hypothetical protein GIB67_039011 [Kingdonia uniflora]